MKVLHSFILLFLGGFLLAGCQSQDWGLDHKGQLVPQSETKGRWVIVSYWAEWCEPCRHEVKELNQLYDSTSRTAVQIFGVNFDNHQGDELRTSVQAMGIRYPTLQKDPSEQLGLALVRALPLTLLIDPKGVVRLQLLGEQTANGLQQQMRALEQ